MWFLGMQLLCYYLSLDLLILHFRYPSTHFSTNDITALEFQFQCCAVIKTWFKFFRFLKKITCMLCIQTLTSHIFVGIHRQFRFQNFLLKMDWLIFFLEIINCNTLCDFLIFCAFWFWAQLEDFLVIVIGTISTFEVINFISPFRVKNLKGMRVIKFICRFLLIFVAFP